MFGNFSLFKTPFPGRSSLPTSFVSFFVFYIFSYLLLKTMAVSLGAWCLLPAFRSCFVEFTQRLNVLLMNLWGRKWSPCPIPPPSSSFSLPSSSISPNVLISWCWYKHSCQCFFMSLYKNLSRAYTYSRITIRITILEQTVKFARWCQIVLKVVSSINTSTGSIWVPWPHNIFKLENFCSSDGHTRFISLWF